MTEQQSGQSMTIESIVGQQEGLEKQPFNLLVWMSSRGIFVFTTLLVVIAAIFVDGFASLDNITDVFNRAAPIGIVAVGMTFVVISANYLDLSVVAQVATAAVVLIAVHFVGGASGEKSKEQIYKRVYDDCMAGR